MSSPVKKKLRSSAKGPILATVPEPVTLADRVVLEIRKFLAAGIFFNVQAAEKVGLGLTDMQMIHMLQLHGPSTPSRLAVFTGLSSGGVTVALDRLEKAGYLRREPNPADRRSLLITLRPVRLNKIAAIYEGVEAETRCQLALLSPRDLEAVLRFFDALQSARIEKRAPLSAPSPQSSSQASPKNLVDNTPSSAVLS